MRKIILLTFSVIIIMLSACSYSESSSGQGSTTESVEETAAQTETATEKITEKITESTTETKQTETTPKETISRAEKLNLGEVDEWDFNSRSKFIYFTDHGRYYPVEIGGRQSANYVLCLDRGYGEPEILTDTEDYTSFYCDENSIYIYINRLGRPENQKSGIYKLENNTLTVIKEIPEGYTSMYYTYFTEEYIYYSLSGEWSETICRMDYDGNNTESILKFENKNRKHIRGIAVYNGKLWYTYTSGYESVKGPSKILAYYDMETGETEEFENCKIGVINDGYMYFEDSDKLFRFDLSSYKCEIVYEADEADIDKHIHEFDFYKDYILYSSDDNLYRMNDNEKTLIFSVEDFFESEGYWFGQIQCQDNRIFILIGSGAFWQCIIEIDIDGNVIEVIHEDQLH